MKKYAENNRKQEEEAKAGQELFFQEEKAARGKIIESLSRIYSSVYYIDLVRNRYMELSSEANVHSYIGSEGEAQEHLNFFCHHMMRQEYTEGCLEFVNLATLEERMDHTRIISRQYERTIALPEEEREQTGWSQCSFIEAGRGEDGHLTHVLFTTQPITKAKIRELEQKKKLEEANGELRRLLAAEKEHTAIMESLSHIFYSLFSIDLEENTMQEILSSGNENAGVEKKENAKEGLNRFIEESVSAEYQPTLRVFTDLHTVDARLGEKRMILQDYYGKKGGWIRCSFIPMEKKKGRNTKVIFALRQISAEKDLKETQDNVIQALSMTFENVYLVNGATGEAVCYRMGRVISERYGQKFACGSYQENIEAYLANDVYEEDRPLFERFRTVEGVLAFLQEKRTYFFNFRVFRNHKQEYYQCHMVKPGEDRDEFVIAFKNVDVEVRAELSRARKLEEQSEIIEGLGSEYYSVLLVDPVADTVTTYRSELRDGKAISDYFRLHNGCWSKGIESYAKELVSKESAGEFLEKLSLERLRRYGEDYSVIYEKKTDSDELMYLQVRVAFVHEKDGGYVAVVGTRNVDEMIKRERQQEMALQAACDAAEAANRAKTAFLSNMSHDIRTPLNGIIGMTAIAAAHADDRERVEDSLQKITRASKHLLSLINEVLDMSKIESGKVELLEESFTIPDLVENLLNMMNAQIKAHHHELNVNISGVIHEKVIGDSLRIQKVFTNIMGNAIKFTPDGGKIALSISEKPCLQDKVGCYEFVFEDNGIGMKEEFLDHVFEPFARAEEGISAGIQGTGLGMPISRNIVRMMGGDIKVESSPGNGSRFTVTMYLKLQDTEEEREEKLINLGVLVADDDQLSLESCCSMLDELGMKADGVTNGADAVEAVVQHHAEGEDYFACILDWKMPGMDGIAAARAIRKAVGEEVPIIILSAYDWSEIEQEARAAGVNAFISKPLFRSRLQETFLELVDGEKISRKEQKQPVLNLQSLQLSGFRVLLVEDNALNAEIATELLNMTGLTVEHASDGREAVDRVAASKDGYYDLILMDIQMPVMNGYDATRAIRSMNRDYCRRIPILAMTANAFAEDVQAARTVGMNEHIAKPLDLDILARTLHKWLLE